MPLNVGGGVGLGLLLSFILCVLLCVRGSRATDPSAGARGLLLVCVLLALSLFFVFLYVGGRCGGGGIGGG